MSTGGIPDVNQFLEDEDGEEDETATGGPAAEDDGREHADDGEEDRQGGTEDEGPDFAEEARSDRPDLSRRQNRIRNLSRRLQESNRRNEDLERRLSTLERNGGRSERPREESQEEEQARMALMAPDERMQYTLDKGMRSVNAMIQNAQMTQAESADLASFRTLAATDRLARRFAPQVEELFQTLKSQGRMTAREIILDYVIGQQARQASNNGQGKQRRRQAEQTISRNRINTGSGRSDVQSERRRGGQSLEQRLEGKLI